MAEFMFLNVAYKVNVYRTGAQGTLEGAAQNFERLSVWKIECQNSKRDFFFLSLFNSS